MKDNVHFGIIGCGGISRFHVHAIQAVEGAQLYGVYDYDPERARAVAAQCGAQAFASLEQLLSEPTIDAVCICTPSSLHFSQAKQALERKKHVLVEKPLTFSLVECDELMRLAQSNGLCAGVVSQLRFDSDIEKVKNALQQNLLGTVTRCDVSMKYFRSEEYYRLSPWRGTLAGDGGGALMNQGIHGVDLVRYLMGEPHSIYALSDTLVRRIEVEDTLTAVIHWKNGAHGILQASVADYPGFERRIEINGEYGSILLNENKIVRWEVQTQGDHVCQPPSPNQTAGHNDPLRINAQGHIRQLEDFVQSIRHNCAPAVTLQDGKNALQLILAAYQSARIGSPVLF